MKNSRRHFSIVLVILLILAMSINLTGCLRFACDPKGKEWFNNMSLPHIDDPLNEIYDGSYSIKVDKDGTILFKPLNGEQVKGMIKTSTPNFSITEIYIEFENGKTAKGSCYQNSSGRTLRIYGYNNESYTFTDKKQYSKEEFENYRSQFIKFLTKVYETGIFPTLEEIESNDLYKKFTDYGQIDPAHGGPITYGSVQKATIEKIEFFDYHKEITLSINGESIVCSDSFDSPSIINISNGQFIQISEDDLREGDCLARIHRYWNSGIIEYHVSKIFYFEN